MNVNLSLNEIEVLILVTTPRGSQDYDTFYDTARQKLLKARNGLLEEASKQGEFFYAGNTIQ